MTSLFGLPDVGPHLFRAVDFRTLEKDKDKEKVKGYGEVLMGFGALAGARRHSK